MKIIIAEGCTAFNTTVDGKSLCDYNNKEIERIYDYVMQRIREGLIDNTVSFNSLVQILQYDGYELNDEDCDQCGDRVSYTIWEI